jgi:hypothetical protein
MDLNHIALRRVAIESDPRRYCGVTTRGARVAGLR